MGQLQRADRAYARLFAGDDPFGTPITSQLRGRAIGYGFGYELSPQQLERLILVLHDLRDGMRVYVRELEGDRRVWITRLTTEMFDRLRREGWTGGVETAVYSVEGTWGVMTSFEGHAIAAGSAQFADALRERIDEFSDSAIRRMLRAWREESRHLPRERTNWILELLRHVYGNESADPLLSEAGFLP